MAHTEFAVREGADIVSIILRPEFRELYLAKSTHYIEMCVLYCAEGDTKVDLGPYRDSDLGEELVLTTICPTMPPASLPDNPTQFMSNSPPEPHALLKGLHAGKYQFIWDFGPEEAIYTINKSMSLFTDGGLSTTLSEVFIC